MHRRIAAQRIRSFLLRYGRALPHRERPLGRALELWLQTLRFEEPAAQAAFDHLRAPPPCATRSWGD